ncbi:uncharacterized protein LOC143433071 [Xylocopa sonorina]|uniref:uncharacterized protein LOC143433071 n=1 Tax=Xylocopa sonorina TaxID=1818115 RepID=UPI00403AD126
MIQPFLEEGAWCYWVVSVGALLSFLGLIVACICSCRRNENKIRSVIIPLNRNEFLGLAGMVTLKDCDHNDGFNRIPMTDALRIAAQDAIDSGKRSTGANRSLPDIPKDKEKRHENTNVSVSQEIYEIAETICDQSELYATVRDADAREQGTTELDVPQLSHQNPLTEETLDDRYSRLASSPNSVEHPYAQLQTVQKAKPTNESNRNKQAIDVDKPSTSTRQANGNPVAPPRTRRSSSHNSLLSVEPEPCDIQAANAISGDVQANQDLPYMTPPLLMLLPLAQPLQSQPTASLQQHFSGDSQDSKGYTSISVREPLANIIAQTKTICRQNQPVRPLTDPHYATVSDDSDEMYAAIDEQEKIYTSGSETYAQIQPTMTEVQRVQNEQSLFSRAPSRSDETCPAPQPPSVDSLRHVAHAHSRQASSSSANSSIVNPGSPKPEKRQANSPLPPPPAEVTVEVYASIEKRTKNEDRSKSTLSNGKSLEDMYAKVVKKKKGSAEEQQQNDGYGRKPSFVEINRCSWSSHDSVELQKKESEFLAGGNTFHLDADVLMKSSTSSSRTDDDADATNFLLGHHGYEPVNTDLPSIVRSDPNYEVLRPVNPVSDYQQASTAAISISPQNNTDLPTVPPSLSSSSAVLAAASTCNSSSISSYIVPFKHRQISNASSEDPGYEKVRSRKRSEMDQDTDSEPNYESMPHDSGEPNYASVSRPSDSDTDPNYESVNHGDPNYESVKYMSVTRAEEPPYERVDPSNNGYEKVNKRVLFNADYERIQRDRSTGPINGDVDDEQYVQV